MRLRLRWRGGALRVSLEPDPDRSRRALAHAAGHALAYAGEAGERWAPGLAVLADHFRAEADAGNGVEAALRAAVERAWPGARIDADPGPLPRWPSTLRIGSAPSGELWPFDAESVGLERGLRSLLKREQFSEAAADRDAAWLASLGFDITPPGPPDEDGRRVIFAAREANTLDEARSLEAQLRKDDGSSRDAGRRLGALLGYPACCVETYVAAEARDDRALAEALLPPLGSTPAPPETQWLSAPLGVVSHSPCSLGCDATRELASKLIAGIEERAPGFEARWRSLARRVHLVSARRALALDVVDAVVRRATELTLPRTVALEGWVRDADEWVGRHLEGPAPSSAGVSPPELRHDGELFLVADHRG